MSQIGSHARRMVLRLWTAESIEHQHVNRHDRTPLHWARASARPERGYVVLDAQVGGKQLGFGVVLLILVGAGSHTARANEVPNGSLETVDPQNAQQPALWEPNQWGDTQASFSYLNSGYEGQRSIRVEVTATGAEGDAKWWSAPFPLPGGKRYRFGNAYRSSAMSELLVRVLGNAGEEDWLSVQVLAPASQWTATSGVVKLPAWSTKVQVLHVLRVTGWLETDSYSAVLETNPSSDGGVSSDGSGAGDVGVPDTSALVSVVFDDGWLSSFIHAVPVMTRLGLRGSHYIIAGWVDKPGYQSDYLTSEQLHELSLAGHEIGSHSLAHENMTQLSASALQDNIIESKRILESFDLQVAGFVPPGGAMNDQVVTLVKEHYRYLRTVEAGLNLPPYEPYQLKCVVVLNSTPLTELAYWVQRAASENGWLILLYHRFSPQAPSDTYVTPAAFQEQMEYLAQAQARVLPIGEVLGVWTPPAPPPPIETGKSLPPYDLPHDDDGCQLIRAPASMTALLPPLLLLLFLWKSRRRRR